MYVRVIVCTSACRWRSEVGIRCLSWSAFTLYLRLVFSRKLYLIDSARLAGQWAPGILSLLSEQRD